MEYPKRPRFFAFKFCRLMAKLCLANEIGADGCWLLATIAMCEDAKGYCGPVTYFNEHLAPLIGSGSVDALARVRAKAVNAGWLHYAKGAKHVAAKYWVLIPPQFCGRMNDKPDTAFDERPSEYVRDYAEECAEVSAEESAEETAKLPRRNRGECAEHSTLSPNPQSPLGEVSPKPPRARFVKPTLADVQVYCTERGNSVDPQRFIDYYESNGWKVGKNPMKSWQAAIRSTWEKDDKPNGKPKQSSTAKPEHGIPPSHEHAVEINEIGVPEFYRRHPELAGDLE